MIHLEDRGPVALLTIDRAERRNALDHEALEQLLEAHAAHRLRPRRGAHRARAATSAPAPTSRASRTTASPTACARCSPRCGTTPGR